MRAIDPNLNHGWYDETYLGAFGFDALGKNVKIHRTVMLPTAKGIAIGDNVTIGPYTVIMAEIVCIGDGATIGSHCVLDGGEVTILPAAIIPNMTSITGEPIEEELPQPARRRSRARQS